MIRAIPTFYHGTQFRSRLEADYAATFDAMGHVWQYEPEGYELSDGTRYLPDFYLPNSKAWVEVKGDHQQRISKVGQFAVDLWGDFEGFPCDEPLVILAQAPRTESVNYLGVRGTSGRYSVGQEHCIECSVPVFRQLRNISCRNCGGALPFETTYPLQEFVRAPR